MKKKEDNIRDLWNNIKCANICILGVPEGEEVPESPRQDKTTLEGTNCRVTEAEERICEPEDRMVELTETKQNKQKEMRPLGKC